MGSKDRTAEQSAADGGSNNESSVIEVGATVGDMMGVPTDGGGGLFDEDDVADCVAKKAPTPAPINTTTKTIPNITFLEHSDDVESGSSFGSAACTEAVGISNCCLSRSFSCCRAMFRFLSELEEDDSWTVMA